MKMTHRNCNSCNGFINTTGFYPLWLLIPCAATAIALNSVQYGVSLARALTWGIPIFLTCVWLMGNLVRIKLFVYQDQNGQTHIHRVNWWIAPKETQSRDFHPEGPILELSISGLFRWCKIHNSSFEWKVWITYSFWTGKPKLIVLRDPDDERVCRNLFLSTPKPGRDLFLDATSLTDMIEMIRTTGYVHVFMKMKDTSVPEVAGKIGGVS